MSDLEALAEVHKAAVAASEHYRDKAAELAAIVRAGAYALAKGDRDRCAHCGRPVWVWRDGGPGRWVGQDDGQALHVDDDGWTPYCEGTQTLAEPAGYTQQEIADACGVSRRRVQQWIAEAQRSPDRPMRPDLAHWSPEQAWRNLAAQFEDGGE